jgi:uncharacterized protein YlxW (UPF0749 family)
MATTKTGAPQRPNSQLNWWLCFFTLCAILGALLGLSFKTQKMIRASGVPAANDLAPQYLVMKKRAEDGERTIATLNTQVRKLENTLPSEKGQFRVLSDDLANSKFLAGLTGATGPGVIVTLNDSAKRFPDAPLAVTMTGIIHDTDILQVVNELRAAGAEAVTVNDQRLVATSPIRCAGPTIFVNGTPQTPPYLVRAIGDPAILDKALRLPQGIYDTLHGLDPGMIKIQKAQTLMLPAYNGPTTTRYAHAVAPGGDSSATDSTASNGAGDGASAGTTVASKKE